MTIRNWLANARVGATVQSVMPGVLTIILALLEPDFSWSLALLALLGVWLAHLAMNLADDYFDFKANMLKDKEKVVRRGIKAYTAKYPYLTDGSVTVNQLRNALLLLGTLAICCGFIVAYERGWTLLLIGFAAGVLGIFYSAPPFKLCYHGLGELVTGIIFGPLLMEGIWWAAAGYFSFNLLYLSVPVGLLVVNILFTHSMIDREGDEASDKLTLAGLMGSDRNRLIMSALLNFGPFLCIGVAVLLGQLHWAYLAVLLVLPRAIWLFWSLVQFVKGNSIDAEIEHPRWFLGSLSNWEAIKKSGLGWFLIRWLTARNLVSGYCLLVILVKLLLIIL